MTNIKVLVVDDEDDFRSNMIRLLEMKDFITAKGVDSGEKALDMLREDDFDIVLLDVKMPGLTAVGTLKALKEMDNPAEVIVLTGHASVDDAVELMNLGAFDYLLKPCPTKEIIKKMTWALENKKAVQ